MQMHAKKSENQHQENDDLWAQPIGLGGNIGDLDLFGDWQDLKRYKIVDAMSSKVLLARDQLQSGSTVALKVVQKSLQVFKKSQSCLLPINIPNMCRLLRYYENEDVIILVIEHTPGDRLYDRVGHIFDVDVHAVGSEGEECWTLSAPLARDSTGSNRRRGKFAQSHRRLSSRDDGEDSLQIDDHDEYICVSDACVEEKTTAKDEDEDTEFEDSPLHVSDEEGREALEDPTEQLVLDSKQLLSDLDRKIERDDSTEKAVKALSLLSQIETEFFSPGGEETGVEEVPSRDRHTAREMR